MIKAYRNSWEGCKHIRKRLDNATATSYIDNLGGLISNSCYHLAEEIWTYCTDQKILLSTVHIPGKDDNPADYMSRLLEVACRVPVAYLKEQNH